MDEDEWFKKLRKVAGGKIHLGHILASQLGGKEKGAKNLTPLYSKPNNPAMNTCEGDLRKLIDVNRYRQVLVKITVIGYGENDNAPDKAKPVMPIVTVLDGDNGPRDTFVIENDSKATTQDLCQANNLPYRK